MRASRLPILALAALVALASALPARQAIHGCLRPEFASAPRVGDLDPGLPLNLDLGLPLPDPRGLAAFITALYDPTSPYYRHFLSPQAFADRFGPSPADYQTLIAFVRAQGLTLGPTHTGRLLLQARGSVVQIERAFHVSLGRRLRTDGSTFFAPDSEPSADLDLPGLSVGGLDDFSRRRNDSRRRPLPANPGMPLRAGHRPLAGTGGNVTYGAAYQGYDFRDAYAPGVTLTGAGQSIGLVEFGGFYSQDLAAYAASSNPALPSSRVVTTVLIDGYNGNPEDNGDGSPGSGGPEGDCGEVSLDIEMALSMAPGATVISYEAPFSASLSDVLAVIADTPVCSQVSSSWGGGTMGTAAAELLQLATQGQGFFSAAGDEGAFASNDAAGPVDEPNSLSPYITVVGGTNLNTGASTTPPIAYVSETTWNDYSGTCSGVQNGCSNCFGGTGGGGVCDVAKPGVSGILTLPSYQSGVSMSTNGGSTTYRDIPDVAAVAQNLWVIWCYGCQAVAGSQAAGQQMAPFDGTSGASPLWAAFTALVNQQALAQGRAVLGFANPALYNLGKSIGYTTDFHDLADGSTNDVTDTGGSSCDPVYYRAVTGYDLTTGWGSPKGQAIIDALVGTIASPTDSPTPTAPPTSTQTFTASPTLSDSPTATPTFTVSPTNTVTPTITETFTRTPTPAYLSSAFGRAILAPDPARGGEPVTLYCTKRPLRSQWRVYTLAGQLLAVQNISGPGPHRWSTAGAASGVYFAQVGVDYADGSEQVLTLKFAVLR